MTTRARHAAEPDNLPPQEFWLAKDGSDELFLYLTEPVWHAESKMFGVGLPAGTWCRIEQDADLRIEPRQCFKFVSAEAIDAATGELDKEIAELRAEVGHKARQLLDIAVRIHGEPDGMNLDIAKILLNTTTNTKEWGNVDKHKITLEQFLGKYSGAPLDLEEVALEASKVSDDGTLSAIAKLYIKAKNDLEAVLDDVGFEFG